jgi:hypothetical protein
VLSDCTASDETQQDLRRDASIEDMGCGQSGAKLACLTGRRSTYAITGPMNSPAGTLCACTRSSLANDIVFIPALGRYAVGLIAASSSSVKVTAPCLRYYVSEEPGSGTWVISSMLLIV